MEVVALLAEQQLQVAGDVPARDVHPHDAVWHGEALVDGHSVCYAITGVEHHACRATSGVSEICHNNEI